MKILLLSAYDAASHQRWRQDLQAQFPQHDWTQLSLPPRYFNWRIRGNSLSWAFSQHDLLSQAYDLLIATSMVDLSSLRGFVPSLAGLPTILYFHENQFAYPAAESQFSSVEPQMVSLYSALCADRLLFNSYFNRDTFLDGVDALLQKLPDQVPSNLVTRLRQRSAVVPVPLADNIFARRSHNAAEFSVIWNHRWEYDKGPERLLAMLEVFCASEIFCKYSPRVRIHVVGQQFRQRPTVFENIKNLLQAHGILGRWGYVEKQADYRQLLSESHLVISTALHDFQGLAVLEAVAAGCVPLVPARQAYPEWFGERYCYPSYELDPSKEARLMAQQLEDYWQKFLQDEWPAPPEITRLCWSALRGNYANEFDLLAAGNV